MNAIDTTRFESAQRTTYIDPTAIAFEPVTEEPINVVDEALVELLIEQQFPEYAMLPIERLTPGGWDNHTFRLGTELSVRLPRSPAYAPQVEREQTWLPRLAAQLPLSIPQPVAHGRASAAYPLPWSIYRWLPGADASAAALGTTFATTLGEFLRALHAIDARGGPAAGPLNFHRGASLAVYEEQVVEAIERLASRYDPHTSRSIWTRARATEWDREPVWVHGDLAPGNCLVEHGRLSAIIDWGCMGVGDPACDLAIAWTSFNATARRAFKAAVALDDATWRRARGWALWKALIVEAGLVSTSAVETAAAPRTLSTLFETETSA